MWLCKQPHRMTSHPRRDQTARSVKMTSPANDRTDTASQEPRCLGTRTTVHFLRLAETQLSRAKEALRCWMKALSQITLFLSDCWGTMIAVSERLTILVEGAYYYLKEPGDSSKLKDSCPTKKINHHHTCYCCNRAAPRPCWWTPPYKETPQWQAMQ